MHNECALPAELPEAKLICLLCKEDQQQSVSQPRTVEIQTREASEETEGHTNFVEMTIQTDADVVTELQTDLPEVAPQERGTTVRGQAEALTDKETHVDLGRRDTMPSLQDITGISFIGQEKSLSCLYLRCVYVKSFDFRKDEGCREIHGGGSTVANGRIHF